MEFKRRFGGVENEKILLETLEKPSYSVHRLLLPHTIRADCPIRMDGNSILHLVVRGVFLLRREVVRMKYLIWIPLLLWARRLERRLENDRVSPNQCER